MTKNTSKAIMGADFAADLSTFRSNFWLVNGKLSSVVLGDEADAENFLENMTPIYVGQYVQFQGEELEVCDITDEGIVLTGDITADEFDVEFDCWDAIYCSYYLCKDTIARELENAEVRSVYANAGFGIFFNHKLDQWIVGCRSSESTKSFADLLKALSV